MLMWPRRKHDSAPPLNLAEFTVLAPAFELHLTDTEDADNPFVGTKVATNPHKPSVSETALYDITSHSASKTYTNQNINTHNLLGQYGHTGLRTDFKSFLRLSISSLSAYNRFVKQPLSLRQQTNQVHSQANDVSQQTNIVSNQSSPTSDLLTHTDAKGHASMVDVSEKGRTCRSATASATVQLGSKAFGLVHDNQLVKGDALSVARLAGIMGAKQTAALIPLCHPLFLDHVAVSVELQKDGQTAVITATCRTSGPTGVEMEALTAVSVAALALYDMCKAVSRDIIITDVKLLSKAGGQRGDYQRHHT